MIRYRHLIALASFVLVFPGLAVAQDSKAAAKPAEQPKEEPKKDPKVEDYEKAVKELTVYKGPFTFYTRKKDILLELPEDKLGKLFFIQATLNSGAGSGAQAGDPLGPFSIDAFRWEKHDEQVWIVRPNFKFRWDKDDSLAVASQRSFPEAILGGFRIEQTNPEKKLLLVNVGNLFNGDLFQIQDVVNFGVGGSYSRDSEKSGVEKIKSEGDNTVLRMFYHFNQLKAAGANPLLALLGLGGTNYLEDSRSLPLRISYNMWYRQPSDYRPRLADPRVGYFTEDFYSLDRFTQRDRNERYIMRWNLRKKDPSATVSEPVKPIEWYLDSSIPDKYREAVRAGILRWNRAFDKLGYKNAVVVKDAPKNDPNWDHADGLHNVFRWTMSPDGAYAIALFRTDPFTGEMLNAAVTFDAGLLAFGLEENQFFAQPVSNTMAFGFEALTRSADPLDKVNRLWGVSRSNDESARKALAKLGWKTMDCSISRELKQQAAFAWNAVVASGLKISAEDYAKQLISDLASHEVGHCMGLRHNFIGSTNLTTEELTDESKVLDQGVSASVMDYVPANIPAILKGKKYIYTPTVGPYDVWAIQYGYQDVKATSPLGERPELAKIARESGAPGHAFMTDEDADSFNPYVIRFDGAKDPLNYSLVNIEAAKRLRKYAIEKLPRAGEDYSLRTNLLLRSFSSAFREGFYSSRFIGGIQGSRAYKGDVGETAKLMPVSAATQRQALKLITTECLSMSGINVPDSVLMSMSQNYSDGSSVGWTAPLRDGLAGLQIRTLATLMSANTTDRVVENQFKWHDSKEGYTIAEHYRGVMRAVFQEMMAGKAATGIRRDVQRFAVMALETQANAPAGGVSDDVRMLATHWLKQIRSHATLALRPQNELDELSQIHYRDLKEGIDRFLQRQVSVGR